MFPFLIQLAKQSYSDDGRSELLLDVLARIDFCKVIQRVWSAMENPSKETKCVLLEYEWTTLEDVRRGLPNKVTRIPNGRIFHNACLQLDIWKTLEALFGNPKIFVYRRRKYVDNVENRHVMQVVLSIQPYAFCTLPPPSPAHRHGSTFTMISDDWTPNN